MVRDRREKFRPLHARYLIIGVMLCIASTIPLFVSMIFAEEGSFLQVAGIASILVLAAVGVLLIIRVSVIWGGYQMLLEEGDYSRENKENNRKYGFIGAIYWCLVTAGFLAWSFIGNSWNISWIVWPVAGVLYGAVTALAGALRKH
jgi:hypothetical protein